MIHPEGAKSKNDNEDMAKETSLFISGDIYKKQTGDTC